MSQIPRNQSPLSAQEKRSLLTDLLRKKAARPKTVPASFAQERLWFLAQLQPDSGAYNVSRAARIKGRLDVPRLRQTLNALIARHESLRTGFDLIEGEPMQKIAPSREVELSLIDLSRLGVEEREADALRLADVAAQRSFNLAHDQLLRAILFKLGEQEHVLLLVMHHMVSDGWSLGILFREIGVLYQAFASGEPPALPDLPIQYADFALWQRKWLAGGVIEKQLEYWRRHLAGAPPVLELPTDRPRPVMQTFSGAYHLAILPECLTASLRKLGQSEGATLFMTLLAAFQTLLCRYTQQEDIVVGTPIANRNRVETENLIGLFTNTLVMRTDLSGDPSFKVLLRRVRETALEAYTNQDLPFEKLVEALHPERNLSHLPMFQVLFALQNAPPPIFKLTNLELEEFRFPKKTTKFDLSLYIGEATGALSVAFEYNTDLFDASTIERMAGHFQALLESIVANPECRISDLPFMAEAEQQRLLVDWKGTRSAYPRNRCVHDLFEHWAEKSPKATAILFEGRQISYDELNRRANQLAHYLVKCGVGPEVIVGICVERSIEMIVGLLGILKAGGAYLPLDPAYPRERLAFMIEDGGLNILLTQDNLRQRLPEDQSLTIALDHEGASIGHESEENLESRCGPENLAYVIYTSGSTGRPKGVSVTHRGVVRLVRDTNYAAFGPAETFLQFASLSFDASTFEIWGSLLNGARLAIAAPGLPSLKELGETIKRCQVTTLWLTAGLFHQMIEAQSDDLRSVKQLLAGGDVLSVSHVEAGPGRAGCQLINGYGPTENTTFTCCYRVKPGERFETSVPIGFAVSNTKVFIADQNMKPMPAGVPGELCIGGDGLARGYLGDAALTAEKFVPDSLSGEAGERLYRTGDKVRYLSDGRIEFLGRMDQQVKIRGYRIEPGEIEAMLTRHKSVKDCVVVALGDGASEKRLAAYFVPSSDRKPATGELPSYLKEKLPEYMIPTFFVEMAELPLTANGKIDWRALPEPGQTRSNLKDQFIEPQTEIEQALAKIWGDILRRDKIGIRDNFFDLGGHSLLAVRLMSAIEKQFDQRIPLVSLFQDATIAHLTSILQKRVTSISWPTAVLIQKGESKPPLFCVSAPNVIALGYSALARHLGPDQSVYGLQAQYPEDLAGEHSWDAVDVLATQYLEALRSIQPIGPYQLAGMCRGAHIAFEMARQLEREGHKVALLGIVDTWVLENTYNWLVYLEDYARRLSSLLRLSFKEQVEALRRKAARQFGGLSLPTTSDSTKKLKSPMHEVYFPGPDYTPRTFGGRISVFRVRRQPLDRIRDAQLGWGKLAGSVDVHVVAGKHTTVLREPNVRVLASELNKCLLPASMNGAAKPMSTRTLIQPRPLSWPESLRRSNILRRSLLALRRIIGRSGTNVLVGALLANTLGEVF